MELTVNIMTKSCYRPENQFWAIIPEIFLGDMAYVFRKTGIFSVDGLSTHASISSVRKKV